jgi:phosphoglycolate phosphatase
MMRAVRSSVSAPAPRRRRVAALWRNAPARGRASLAAAAAAAAPANASGGGGQQPTLGERGGGGARTPVRAVIFDKDGTLVDFEKTWGVGLRASAEAVAALPHCRSSSRALLEIGGMCKDTGRVRPESLFSDATGPVIAQAWAECFEQRPEAFRDMATEDALCQMIEGIWSSTLRFTAAPLGDVVPVLERLQASGVRMACVTNDTEAEARSQLGALGIDHLMGAFVGYDSGHGRKPDPGGVLWALQQLEVPPSEAITVGDSPGDIIAGASAGCVGRFSVNSTTRGGCRMDHPDVTHDIDSIEEMVDILGLP